MRASVRSRLRVAVVGVIAIVVLLGCSPRKTVASKANVPTTRYSRTEARWPEPLCRASTAHRFTGPATGQEDMFVVRATAHGRQPVISAATAYQHFVRIYGRPTPEEHAQMSIRYGSVTSNTDGGISANVIGAVAFRRRIPGWVIVNCAMQTPPPAAHKHGHRPGSLVFVVSDTRRAATDGWQYVYRRPNGTQDGFIGGGSASGRPPYKSTRYYSTNWSLAGLRSQGEQILLKYKKVGGYCLDHVDIADTEGHPNKQSVAVILSTNEHGQCDNGRDSGYADAHVYVKVRGPKSLQHLRTGPRKFRELGFTSLLPGTGLSHTQLPPPARN